MLPFLMKTKYLQESEIAVHKKTQRKFIFQCLCTTTCTQSEKP